MNPYISSRYPAAWDFFTSYVVIWVSIPLHQQRCLFIHLVTATEINRQTYGVFQCKTYFVQEWFKYQYSRETYL